METVLIGLALSTVLQHIAHMGPGCREPLHGQPTFVPAGNPFKSYVRLRASI